MGKRKKPMIDTSTVEEEEEVGPSRTMIRQEAKLEQNRREALAMMLSKLHDPALVKLDLGENVEKEVRTLKRLKNGSALARQRRRVASSLRHLELDEIEQRITVASEHQKGR